MDWEANLAAIIKCTDASLAQQFRQFEDVSAEFSAAEAPPQHEDRGGNVAAAYLRETMASDFCHRQQQERENEPTPTYSRVSGAFTRGSAAAAPATSSFSEHFHRRQERKRGATATARMKDNQRLHRRGDADYGPAEDEVRVQDHEVDEPRYANPRPAGGYPQMYSSPTYDMAQMMEQVRLSLKLEVDARAAIAERQLSALLQLCKATSEELDRLRVEVCANDRQLHTLDQVQSKIRQELTTQKDIGFHLQSMCGKDESWRMQTENQLLELRQMVAALREQGNSTQAVAQEKLSRSELLVQFNAAMEPIKAQLQANLQHQAQQIADITRTTSSSSLLLDGLTQKVNRSITDEMNELRSDLNALKHHVAKMDIFQDGGRGDGIQVRSPALTKEEHEAKTKEKRQQQENKLNSLQEDLVKELTAVAKDYVDSQIKPIRQIVDENGSKFVGKQEMENMQNSIREGCQNRCAAAVVQADSQIRSIQDQLRGENNLAIRDCCDQLKQSIQQTATGMKTALEGQSTLWQSKQHEVVQMIEKEKTERKQAWDEIDESLRKNRHQLEDKIHTLTHESHTKLLQHGGDFEKRLKEIERQFESSIAVLQKESQVTVANLNSSIQTLSCNNTVEWEQKLKRLEETVSGTNLSVAALSKSVTSLTATSTMASSEPNSKDVSLALEKQTNVYVSTMENLLQKMQLQLQLQSQSQVQMTMAPSPFHGYWPPSPYAATQLPPAPTLHLPASIHHSSMVNPEEYNALPAVADIAMHTAPTAATSNSSVVGTELNELAHAERSDKNDKSADRLSSPMTLHETVKSNSTPISDMVPSTLSTASSSTPKALVQNNLPKSEQTPINLDETNKWQHTLATTAKGALAEAELAKARVESRRKQESETKQHRPLPAQEGEKPSAYMPNSIDPVEPGCRRSSVPIAVSGQTSVLTRSASSSALPEKGALANTALEDSKPVNSSITAGNHSVSSKDATSRPSASAQSTLKAGGNAGAPILPSSQGAVKNNSKPLATNFSAGDPSQVALKGDLDSAGSLQLQSVSKEDAHNEQSITVETQREAQQKEAKDFTLSVPNVSDSSAANNEQLPPLSPLSKLFARPTAVRAAAVNGDDVVPVDLLSTGNVSETTGPTDTDKAQLLPALPAVSADNPPVSHILCALCRIPVRSDKKVEHEHSQCPKRMVECVSCKEQMQWVAHEMHELECNSTKCNQSSVADTRSSLSEAKGPPDVSDETELGGSLKKCRHCSADVPSLDLLEHEINCDKVLKQCPHCLRRQKMSELQDHIENCDCRLVSCPNDCGGKFLQRGIPNHLATRCPKKQTTPAATSPPSSTDSAKLPTAPPVTRSPSAPPTAEKVFYSEELKVLISSWC
ncbi:unnamed protein product [Phytophthora lilii]|uniref:Unnamed protein product n=1 Tax=Phytophthora lilii TaxID=2077276 RepID=A0A9W7D8B8_9STRA|nr:unnamed protein product [Phytophthora lilii]